MATVSNMKSSPGNVRAADTHKISLDTEKIRTLRLALGLTQAEAAMRAGLPGRQRWYHLETGKLKNPTLETIERIAAALGVKAKDLLK